MNKLPVPTSKPFSPLFVAFTVAVDGTSRRNISKSQLSVVVATCVTTSARVVTPYAPTMPEYSIRELTSADLRERHGHQQCERPCGRSRR